MWKKYLIIIGFSLIPAILLFIGKNTFLFDWMLKNNILLKNQSQIAGYQFWCFVIGIFGSGLVIPSRLAYIQHKYELKTKSFIELIKYNKNNQFESLRKDIKQHNHPFNTRVFKKSKGLIAWFKCFFFNETTLNLVHYDSISDVFHHKNLSFKVNDKSVEGMVGKSFKEEAVFIDMDMSIHNKYFLTKSQQIKVGNVEFCSTIPIFGKNNKIVAVVGVDSEQKLDLDANALKNYEKDLRYYASFIEKHLILN